jgi:acetylornithine deacetylase
VTSLIQELEPEMKAVNPRCGFRVKLLSGISALDTDENAEVVKLGQAFSSTEGSSKVSFATEGGAFHKAGVPTIIIGPGSITEAHRPDEYVELEQLRLCEQFMENLLQYARTK